MKNEEVIKKILVTIKGLSPLLMNKPDMARFQSTEKQVKKVKVYDIKIESETSAYRDGKGFLAIPAIALHRCMIMGSSGYKAGKKSLMPYIAGSLNISPEMISLGVKEFEIDLRTVVIQRQRVLKARPKIVDWSAEFELHYDSRDIVNAGVLHDILDECGRRIGILDYRPACKGPYGKFEVVKSEEM